MVKTLEYAQRKWERKTAGKGAKWKEAASESAARACTAMSEFIGHSVPEWCSAQKAGVDGVSASDFEAAIRGKGAKWASGMRRIH